MSFESQIRDHGNCIIATSDYTSDLLQGKCGVHCNWGTAVIDVAVLKAVYKMCICTWGGSS